MTYNQLCKPYTRIEKPRHKNSPRMEAGPQRKATCIKVYTTTPKKPNSAIRKVAKVFIHKSKKYTIAYIPGFGHSLAKFSKVMLRGGRVPDLPGVKYHLIRNLEDFSTVEKIKRARRRSKYGI